MPELHPEFHGLTEGDLETVFNSGSLQGVGEIKLTEIINILRNTYCKNIGAEYMHIVETNEKRWIQQKLEPFAGNFPLEKKERIQLISSELNILASSCVRIIISHRAAPGNKQKSKQRALVSCLVSPWFCLGFALASTWLRPGFVFGFALASLWFRLVSLGLTSLGSRLVSLGITWVC